MKNNKGILSKTLLANSPDEAMNILRDAGVFDSIQCHGYAKRNEDSIKINKIQNKDKKWWQFWKFKRN